MVAVNSPLSPLRAAVLDGTADLAMELTARALLDGVDGARVAEVLLETALALCGREAAGASWMHALLSVGATTELLQRSGPEVVAPAVVGAAGFLTFARPTRLRAIPGGAVAWPGTRDWLRFIQGDRVEDAVRAFRSVPGDVRDEAWREASLVTSAGWGHQAILGGHVTRLAARYAHLDEALHEAAIRAWTPPEVEGEPFSPEGGPVEDGILEIAKAVSISPGTAVSQAGLGQAVEGAAVAALELLRRTQDLRTVHGVTYAREVLALHRVQAVRPDQAERLLAFVAGGWDRARRDRRIRKEGRQWGQPSWAQPGDWTPLLAELCRVELRPGFGHNVKIADSCVALADLLPAGEGLDGLAFEALRATLPAWSRSRRPWLALQKERRSR